MKRGGVWLVVGVSVVALGACAHPQSVSASPRDRAACAQVGVAYAALSAWNGGPPPTAKYREAIAAANRASNPKLSDAIADWMTNVMNPSSARPGPDAGYTMEECRQIGVPLKFTAAQPRQPSSPSTTGDSEGSDDD
jgi:hypothetical protein